MSTCKKHNYNGLTAPKAHCDLCLSLFASKGVNRPARVTMHKSAAVMKDKSKYSRKAKFTTAWWLVMIDSNAEDEPLDLVIDHFIRYDKYNFNTNLPGYWVHDFVQNEMVRLVNHPNLPMEFKIRWLNHPNKAVRKAGEEAIIKCLSEAVWNWKMGVRCRSRLRQDNLSSKNLR